MSKLEELKKLYESESHRYNSLSFQSRWVGGGVSDEEVANSARYVDLLAAQIKALEKEGDTEK
jgi:hypothetical protein